MRASRLVVSLLLACVGIWTQSCSSDDSTPGTGAQGGAAGMTSDASAGSGGAAGHAGSSGAAGAGVADCSAIESKRMVDLTAAETAAACDCMNGLLGGYGKHYECEAGDAYNSDKDQASCVSGMQAQACSATVSQLLKCWKVIGADICSIHDTLQNDPACQPYWSQCGL